MSFLETKEPTNMEFEPVPVGDYEAFVTSVEETQYRSGSSGYKLTFTIRDDVSGQGYGRRKIFENFVATEKALFRFNDLAVACGAPVGHTFPTADSWAKFVQSKPVIISIRHEKYTNNDGEVRTVERVRAFKPSVVGGTAPEPTTADPFASTDAPIQVSDDDLPF